MTTVAPVAPAATNDPVLIITDGEGALMPLSAQPLMGSSRISGGVLRGLARGNVPNHADFTTTNLKVESPVKGEVYLYLTDQYPRHVKFESLKGDSGLVVKVKVMESMAPILDMVSHKFSIIQSACFFFKLYLFKILNLNLDQENSIYYRQSTSWIALGTFDQAMKDDDECEWEIVDGTHELHLLIVSLNYRFIFWIYYNFSPEFIQWPCFHYSYYFDSYRIQV